MLLGKANGLIKLRIDTLSQLFGTIFFFWRLACATEISLIF